MGDSQPESGFQTNPYAPTALDPSIQDELTDELVQSDQEEHVPASFAWTALCWYSICGISAIPSFIVGFSITNGRWDAMLVGVFIFSIAYACLDYATSGEAWRQKKLIRRTLRTMYGTRIAITILFPIGYTLDLFCGFVSINMTQAFAGAQFRAEGEAGHTFAFVLLTTLIQGSVMNVVLAVYGALVLLLLAVVAALRE